MSLGRHKKMNPKSGRGGKLLRGDKKEIDIFGKKGLGKEQRDPKGISRNRIESEESKKEVTTDDLSILRTLLGRRAFDYNSALNYYEIMERRINIEKDDWDQYLSKFMDKYGERRWITLINKPTINGNLPHLYFNIKYKNDIRYFIENPPKYL